MGLSAKSSVVCIPLEDEEPPSVQIWINKNVNLEDDVWLLHLDSIIIIMC